MLKIRSLYLNSFKNVDSARFMFDDGVYLFSGSNGEGKSTVFHALNLLLFDSSVSNLKDYIQWGRNEFDIGCEFEIDGRLFNMTMLYNQKNGGDRRLEVCGRTYTNRQAMAVLSEYLDLDIARASIVSLENEYNLISVTPSKRREYLKSIYDLEFRIELEKIESDIDRLEKTVTENSSKIQTLKSQTYKTELLERLPMSSSDYLSYKDRKEELNRIQFSLNIQRDKNLEIQKKLEEKGRLRVQYRQKRDSIESEYRSLGSDRILTTDLDVLLSAVVDKTEQIEKELSDSLNRIEDEILSNRSLLKDRQTEDLATVVPAREEVEELRELYESSVQVLNQKKGSLLHLQQEYKILGTGVCPTCGQSVSIDRLDMLKNSISSLEKEIEDQNQNVLSKRSDYLSLQKTRDDLMGRKNSIASEIRSLTDRIRVLEDKKIQESRLFEQKLSSERSRIENERLHIRSERERLEKELRSLSESLTTYDDLISQTEKEIEDYRAQIVDDSVIREQEATVDSELSEVSRKISTYETVLRSNDKKMAINEAVEQRRRSDELKMEEIQKDLERDGRVLEYVTQAKKILTREFPSYVISRLISNLKRNVNEFLEKVYPKYQVDIEETRDALKITYGENHADVKMASGFEKSAFSLAYMYALGKIQNYGILMIDEGDSAASDENSMRFYDTLGKSSRYFHQIFAITHREEARELLKNEYRATVYTVADGCYRLGE